MTHTQDAWFLHFHGAGQGAKDAARIHTSDGAVVMALAPDHGQRPRSAELRAAFEDNARVAAAGNALLSALEVLMQAAREAGLPAESVAYRAALEAVDAAKPAMHLVLRDGERRFRGTHNECFAYIHRAQGQSVDHAMRYEGWAIVPDAGRTAADEPEASGLRP